MNQSTNPRLAVPPAAVCEVVRCDAVLVPLLAGSMLSCVLLGVLCILGIAAFWGRSRLTKLTILLVIALQFTQTLTDTLRTTLKYGLHYGDLAYWIRTTTDDALAVFFGVLLQAQTQAFMLGRANKYAGLAYPVPRAVKRGIVGVVGVVIVGSLVCGCAVAVLTKTLGSYEELVPSATGSPKYTILVHCWLISSAVLDTVLAASITHELVRARKWSSDRTTTAAWVRAIARKMVIVIIQSGFLLATVQTITLVLWRVEMKTPTTRGTAYVFFPITILPKLYTITYFVILLCTPPPGAFSQAAASSTSAQAWVTASPSDPSTPTSERKETVVDVPALDASLPHHPNLLPQVLSVRPDWISLEQTQAPERTVRSRSWSNSTAVTNSVGSPTARSRGRLGSDDTLASQGSPKHTLHKIKVDDALSPIAEADVELEYYRSYAAALEASRTPRKETFEQSPSVSIFPMIEHPYAAAVSERAVREIEVPAVPGLEVDVGEGEVGWDDTPTVKSAAPTVIHFDADECLAKYRFGTHKDEVHLEVPLADKAEQLRIKHEFAQHARNFMRPSVCSAADSTYHSEVEEQLEWEEGEEEDGAGLGVPPKLARLESDASFVCAREAKRMSSGRMVY